MQLQGAHAQLAAFFAEDPSKFKPEELYSQLLSFLSQLDKAAMVPTPQLRIYTYIYTYIHVYIRIYIHIFTYIYVYI